MTAKLRVFTYLPNPRIWKATIAARLCGVELELRGAAVDELAHWLWDFDARYLEPDEHARLSDTFAREAKTGFAGRLVKTEAFLQAQPFGTVPAAFSPDGATGIFESNSIMRTVARLGSDKRDLYGDRGNPYVASRVDAFLDAALVFSRDAQHYMLALRGGSVVSELQERAQNAVSAFLGGAEQALSAGHAFLVGDDVTLADICFVAELASLMRERTYADAITAAGHNLILDETAWAAHQNARAHFEHLCEHSAFAPDLEPFLHALKSA